jgi:hypothetical protein
MPQLFALIFGSKYYQLPRVFRFLSSWSAGALHQLEFQQENLTSICSSLKEFECTNYCLLVGKKSEFWTNPSVIAFILRHFRNLQKLSHTCYIDQCKDKVFSGVVALFEESAIDNSEMTSMTLGSQSFGAMHLTINAPFRGIY